jgi:hypothetical protein
MAIRLDINGFFIENCKKKNCDLTRNTNLAENGHKWQFQKFRRFFQKASKMNFNNSDIQLLSLVRRTKAHWKFTFSPRGPKRNCIVFYINSTRKKFLSCFQSIKICVDWFMVSWANSLIFDIFQSNSIVFQKYMEMYIRNFE